jgi:hypothetical protein
MKFYPQSPLHPKIIAGPIAVPLVGIGVWVAGLFGLDVPLIVDGYFVAILSPFIAYWLPGPKA